ncbi:MAG TPA: AarF/UbiB family protein [Ktedonobacteraceae bacterium]|jgi:predicted unusual protein kinase regulating ubiquinone biosynthesis (AarF/ABC1/UbiB family)
MPVQGLRRNKDRSLQLTWWRKWWRAGRVLRLLLWTLWVIYRERRRVLRARARGDYTVQPDIDVLVKVLLAFRQTALKLGVLLIKLGQFLSARADLLPEQALAVLASLQDEVPPESFDHVVSVIESELGKPVEQVFSMLERKATAAASLGQVHKAVLLTDGRQVAVKVQRPYLDQLVKMDLSTLKFVIRVINRFVDTSEFIDLLGVYREFKRTVYEEIDYLAEADNARRFREMFADDPCIFIPRVYDEYTSRRVLVLEWVEGIKINDYPALEAAGIDRLEVANRTVEAYFHQFFQAGFFHADPHPGNIFVRPDASGREPVIEFVDFGMVGQLDNAMKRSMKDLFLSFVLRDSHALASALQRLGFIGEGANMQALERGIALMMEQYYGMTLGEARNLDIPDVAQDVGQLLYGQPFQIPAQFAFMGRAISTLVGVATGLAPAFNFVDVATPYARKFLGLDTGGVTDLLRKLPGQALETGRLLVRLPAALEQLITRLETGQIEVRLAPDARRGYSGRRRRRGRGQENPSGVSGISWVLLSAVTLAGGIFLLTGANLLIPGWFFLALSALSGLRLLFKR